MSTARGKWICGTALTRKEEQPFLKPSSVHSKGRNYTAATITTVNVDINSVANSEKEGDGTGGSPVLVTKEGQQ